MLSVGFQRPHKQRGSWLDLRDQRIVVLGAGAEMGPPPTVGHDAALVTGAGADLLHRLPQAAAWLRGRDGRLVLATTCTPTAPRTCGSPLRSTRSPST